MKKTLSLLTLLMLFVASAWADTIVLGTPDASVATLSDANGIVTITDASGSTGIQQGSGSYKVTYDGTAYVPMKLSGSREFTLSYKEGVTINKVTLMAMSNSDDNTGTVGAGSGDATSLGTFPARNKVGNWLTVDITGKTGLRGSRQFLALIVVEYTEASAQKTVTFVGEEDYPTAWAYAWNDQGEVSAPWPGDVMTKVAERKWVWTTTGNPTMIIFSHDTAKTGDMEFVDGATYTFKGRAVTATLTTDMEQAYAYVWSGEGENELLGGWPGRQLTGTEGVYDVIIPTDEAPEFIIFHNNNGVQTENLAFEDGKAYEFTKKDFTATFITDAAWDKVYAWTWSGDVNFEGVWPGKELTAQEGVYTYTYNGYYAPENILFNGGDDTKKTADMAFVDGKAYKYITATPLFAIQPDVTYTYGQTVEVEDGDEEVVATITFGNEGEQGDNFKTTKAQTLEGYLGYVAQTDGGNGKNGNQTGGTTYTIKPVYDGKLSVAVKVGGGKKFHLLEDGVAVAPHDGFQPTETYYGTIDFDVTGGKAYKFYCDGSKLDIFGFDYQFTKPEVEKAYYLVGSFNEWTINESYKLEANTQAAEGVKEYMITVELPANTKLKVQDGDGEYYPSEGSDMEVNDAGNYTIYFRPNADGGSDWHYGCIYCNYNGPSTGISSMDFTAGQNATVFNMKGQRVAKAQKGLYIVNGKKLVVK